MESREKCEQIIQIFNGTQLQGAKDPLLVKFADGGSKKKNNFKSPDPNQRAWREVTEGVPVTYDQAMQQNGMGVNVGTPIGMPAAYGRYGAPPVGGFAMPGYMPGYMMAQPIQQVDEQVRYSNFNGFFWIFYQFLLSKKIQKNPHDSFRSVLFLFKKIAKKTHFKIETDWKVECLKFKIVPN